jgi:hypothetical protein
MGHTSDLYPDSAVILSSLRCRAPLKHKILSLLYGHATR